MVSHYSLRVLRNMSQNVANEHAGTQCNRSELLWFNKFKIEVNNVTEKLRVVNTDKQGCGNTKQKAS